MWASLREIRLGSAVYDSNDLRTSSVALSNLVGAANKLCRGLRKPGNYEGQQSRITEESHELPMLALYSRHSWRCSSKFLSSRMVCRSLGSRDMNGSWRE